MQLTQEDISIIADIILEITTDEISGEFEGIELMTFDANGPTILTPGYRIGELQKLRSGIDSERGRVELEAEKLYRNHENDKTTNNRSHK